MRDFIHPIGGFEVVVMTWPDKTDATAVSFGMEGWEWFILLSVEVAINNTGGGVAANATVTCNFSQNPTFRCASSVAAGIASSQTTEFQLNSPTVTIAGLFNTVPLPWVFNPSASSISISFNGGDAATRISKGQMTIAGLRKLTNPKRQ